MPVFDIFSPRLQRRTKPPPLEESQVDCDLYNNVVHRWALSPYTCVALCWEEEDMISSEGSASRILLHTARILSTQPSQWVNFRRAAEGKTETLNNCYKTAPSVPTKQRKTVMMSVLWLNTEYFLLLILKTFVLHVQRLNIEFVKFLTSNGNKRAETKKSKGSELPFMK